ncbi:MAG: hypothetical protein P8130_10705 [Deltaproteobacteria bacterium]
MLISHSIDHDRRYMTATAKGPISLEEVRSHLLVERLEGGLSYPELIDARDATPNWSSTQAREIVELLTSLGRESTLGPTVVVVSDDLGFGMLRMLEILLEDVCIVKPFRDYAAAEQWLWSWRRADT